jgi:hypothetical protein
VPGLHRGAACWSQPQGLAHQAVRQALAAAAGWPAAAPAAAADRNGWPAPGLASAALQQKSQRRVHLLGIDHVVVIENQQDLNVTRLGGGNLNRASQTAGLMAVQRGLESARAPERRLFDDPFSRRFISLGWRIALAAARLPPAGTQSRPYTTSSRHA